MPTDLVLRTPSPCWLATVFIKLVFRTPDISSSSMFLSPSCQPGCYSYLWPSRRWSRVTDNTYNAGLPLTFLGFLRLILIWDPGPLAANLEEGGWGIQIWPAAQSFLAICIFLVHLIFYHQVTVFLVCLLNISTVIHNYIGTQFLARVNSLRLTQVGGFNLISKLSTGPNLIKLLWNWIAPDKWKHNCLPPCYRMEVRRYGVDLHTQQGYQTSL